MTDSWVTTHDARPFNDRVVHYNKTMKKSHYAAVLVAAEDRQHPLLIQPDVMRKTNHGIGIIRINLPVFRFAETLR